MKKRVLSLLVMLVLVSSLVGFSQGKAEQRELISNFLEKFYSYEYSEENSECEEGENDSCSKIREDIKSLLTSDTRIDWDTVNALVVSPANFSKVSVNYDSYEVNHINVVKKEDKELYIFNIVTDVLIKSSLNNKEIIKPQPSMGIVLVLENNEWKIEGLDYMADDYLFYADSLFY